MRRIRMMLLALVAVLAIGCAGASAASADSWGYVEVTAPLVGDLGCDMTFDVGTWDADGEGYGTDVTDMAPDVNGSCDIDGFASEGRIYKEPLALGGYAEFDVSLDMNYLSPLIACKYAGILTGTWDWYDPPANEHKQLTYSGTLTRLSGSSFLCPTTMPTLSWMVAHY